MRYFVFPHEGLSDDLRAALTRGLGLASYDTEACRRHCARYGIDDVEAFIEELEEAQTALATAYALGAPLMTDWRGRLCYELPRAADDDRGDEDEKPLWQSDDWLASLLAEPKTTHRPS